MTRLIVLRPEPGASETVRRARELGFEVISFPLFAIEPVPWEAPDPAHFDALLLTSANAVRFAGDDLLRYRGLKTLCVGQATAEKAREAGFDVASVGSAGVERLLGSVESDQRLLHLAGEDRTELGEAKQEITAVAVYRSRALPAPETLRETDGAILLVHSPRAGKRLVEVADELRVDRSRVALAAISKAALEASGGGWAETQAADKPDDPSLLALARAMCDSRPRP
ncbi:uroporphyrinogen-III synthase [Sphingomonas piscis]|uniref:Uroporphyrinogen-III synthase n=1 Tax=Sphingomonas piscis TaxID=2714943 RepID=A0A6G7YPH3_9SPHN|nr:uroporphyrinogen-III synthase [Sphingomonas piscis]QIK78639.1 uroporphyrinogen-III synthase [Sphingomonas piscis]